MFNILLYISLSLSFIISIHYIFFYLMEHLTIPITKDLIIRPEKQYKELYQTINNESSIDINNNKHDNNENNNKNNNDNENNDMKSELLKYFKTLSNKQQDIKGVSNLNTFTNY